MSEIANRPLILRRQRAQARSGPEGPFPHLFSPIEIAGMTLRNRIVVPPHGVVFAAGSGDAIERVIDYHVEKAKGGAALVTMSNYVVPDALREEGSWGGLLPLSAPGALNVCTLDDAIPHYRRLAAALHAEGAKFVSQLNASGRQGGAGPGADAWGFPLWAPSAIPCPETGEIPKEMEPADIAAFVEAYAHGARNMQEAGADGVELFAAQGYLLSEFLSPHANKRTDAYGGSLENRMRFVEEALRAIRAATDRGFVVGIRMNGADFAPGGLTLDESREIARRLAAARLVDYFNVSGRTYLQWPGWIADASHPAALFADLAGEIRGAVPGTPVCVVGRIGDPALADRLIADGKTDLVGMVRALISDPELPNKARRGEVAAIRRCTYGNQSCIMGLMKGKGVACMHNPAVGHERHLGIGTLHRTEAPKKVVVVGGGPAGLAAAGAAAARGHKVVLFEAASELGGQNRYTARMDARRSYGETTRWLVHRLETGGADVRLGVAADRDDVLNEAPDAVIVATGSRPLRTGYSSHRPDVDMLPGAERDGVCTLFDVFETPERIGENVLVVDEDPHMAAVYVAEHLAETGRRVTVATPGIHPGRGVQTGFVPELYRRIRPKGVRIAADTFVTRIEDGAVAAQDRYTGEAIRFAPVDTVVLAMGNAADDALYRALRGTVADLTRIGDCLAPRRLDDAIRDGERAGRTV